MWFLVAFLVIVIIVLSFFISNLLNQNKQLESEVKKLDKREEKLYIEIENYYKIFLGLFTEAYTNMQRVDKRGSFSSDDEVGFAFKVIYNAIQEVQTKLENLKVDDENETEKG